MAVALPGRLPGGTRVYYFFHRAVSMQPIGLHVVLPLSGTGSTQAV
jgi:hypothetical protein